MPELFLEIGTEEIPAGYIKPAFQFLEDQLTGFFRKNRIECGSSRSMGTPRRLIVSISEVADRQKDVVETYHGPSVKTAYDTDGKPTQAALGFARSKGIDISALTRETTTKGEVICTRVEKMGQPTSKLLNNLLPQLISDTPFPKKMRWGGKVLSFARPIQWIAAYFDAIPLEFEWNGLPCQKQSSGHRFLKPGTFSFDGLASYLEQSERHFLMVDPDTRKHHIKERILLLAKEIGGVIEDDPDLLEEVTYLVEYPVAIRCDFESKYLDLPKELLVIAMKHHQRYFPIYRPEGSLLPNFITISNIQAEDFAEIKRGNERVLRARLEDARFFYDEDRKKKLGAYVEPLKGMVFQKNLGTLYDKVTRIVTLAQKVAERICPGQTQQVQRAAHLCKADLVTQMVFEFPELQGITGGYYALHSGEDPEVAQAIQEHYRPTFAGDALPSTPIGCAVAIGDKMDTILGCICVGLIPTGSEDPYALRRHALGVIQIVLKGGWNISLNEWINQGMQLLSTQAKFPHEQTRTHVIDLFTQRFKSLLNPEGYPYDAIDAVLATGIDSLIDVKKKVKAIADLKAQPYFELLATTFRRVVSILTEDAEGPVQDHLLIEPQEKKLHDHFLKICEPVEQKLVEKDFAGALEKIVQIKPSVDQFFDHVLVMDKDEAFRQNRLHLLYQISLLFSRIADFSKIVVKKS